MSYSFLDQQNKLSSLCGDPNATADDQWPLAVRKKEINRGEMRLAIDAKDLFGYATGTVSGSTITFPTDWSETYMLMVNGVIITNDREIAIADYQRYETGSGDAPYYYKWVDASGDLALNLLGSADGMTYKWWYFRKPSAELSADADISEHQEEFREGAVYYAASELMRQISKNAQADEFLGVYAQYVERADAWARRYYIDKKYARPDFGPMVDNNFSTDVQGRSYP